MPNYDLGTAHGRIIIDSSTIGRSVAALDKLSKGMLAIGAIGAVAFGYAIKSASDFEVQLDRFGAVSDSTEKDMERLRKKALQLGQDSAYGATEVVKGFVELAKAGFSVQEVLDGVGDAAVQLAAAGEIPLAEATDVLAIAIRTFGLEAKDAIHVADLLAGVANASLSSVEDLAVSFKYAAPVAQTLGINIDDLVVALGLFSQVGIKGSTAGTSLRGMFVALTAPSEKALGVMREYGIVLPDGTNKMFDATGKAKGLGEMFQVLQDALGGLPPATRNAALAHIFQRRALAAAARAAFDGAKGFDAMKKVAGRTTAEEVMKEKLDNLQGSLKILKASLETFAITIGEMFLPALKEVADFLRRVTNHLIDMDPELRDILVKVALGVTAFFLLGGSMAFVAKRALIAYRAFRDLALGMKIVGALFLKYTGIGAAFKAALKPIISGLETLYLMWLDTAAAEALAAAPVVAIVLGLLAIAAAAYFLWTKWDEVWKLITENPYIAALLAILFAPIAAFISLIGILKWVWENWDEIWGWIKQAAADAVDFLIGAWDDVEQAFNDAVEWIGQAVDDIIKWFEKLPENAEIAVNDTLDFLQHLPETLAELAGQAIEWLAEMGANIIRGLTQGIADALPGLTAWLLGLPALIIGFFLDAWSWLLGPGLEMLHGFLQGAIVAAGDLWVWIFGTLIPTLIGFFGDAGVWLLSHGWDLLFGFWQGALNIYDAVMEWFAGLGMSVVRAVGDLLGHLVNAGWSLIRGLWDGALNLIEGVLGWFRGLPGSINTAIGDLGSLLLSKGADLIEGFWNGAKRIAEKVKNWAEDFAESIADKVTGFFGFGSPSKLFRQYGRWTLEGMLLGLQDMAPKVLDYMDSFAPQASAQVAAVATTAGSMAPVSARSSTTTTDYPRPVKVVEQNNQIYALDARQAVRQLELERVWAERTAGEP